MTSRVSSKNKGNRLKGKIALKKKDKKTVRQVNRKLRRRESNPVYMHL